MRTLFAFMALAAIFAIPTAPAHAQNKLAPKTEAVKNETAKTEVTNKTEVTKQKRAPSPAQEAMRERQRTCAAEWKTAKANKAAGTTSTIATTWPKFWSECNKRLKQKQG